jgi:hypothetical protein
MGTPRFGHLDDVNQQVVDATPAITLRHELARARAGGEDFEAAWPGAVRRAVAGAHPSARADWRTVLGAHREVWEEAFGGGGEPAAPWAPLLAVAAA